MDNEHITVIIHYKDYIELRKSHQLNEANHTVKYVDEPFDYTKYPQWVEAKKESDKAFRELKKIEFDIRNK